MSESKYKHLLDQFLNKQISVDDFIENYFNQWKNDRDGDVAITNDLRLQRLINRRFASGDRYSENPEGSIEISKNELKKLSAIHNESGFCKPDFFVPIQERPLQQFQKPIA